MLAKQRRRIGASAERLFPSLVGLTMMLADSLLLCVNANFTFHLLLTYRRSLEPTFETTHIGLYFNKLQKGVLFLFSISDKLSEILAWDYGYSQQQLRKAIRYLKCYKI